MSWIVFYSVDLWLYGAVIVLIILVFLSRFLRLVVTWIDKWYEKEIHEHND
jgi:hypothetical protein